MKAKNYLESLWCSYVHLALSAAMKKTSLKIRWKSSACMCLPKQVRMFLWEATDRLNVCLPKKKGDRNILRFPSKESPDLRTNRDMNMS